MTIPHLPAVPEHHGLKVWCVYCRRWHHHASTPGHRVAHCTVPTSPYRQSGYVLEPQEEPR